MARMTYGRNCHKTKIVKGLKNGSPTEYEIKLWTNSYKKDDPKADYYSVTYQVAGGWSFSGGYGTEVKTNIKTLASANKAVMALTNKIRKHTNPFK